MVGLCVHPAQGAGLGWWHRLWRWQSWRVTWIRLVVSCADAGCKKLASTLRSARGQFQRLQCTAPSTSASPLAATRHRRHGTLLSHVAAAAADAKDDEDAAELESAVHQAQVTRRPLWVGFVPTNSCVQTVSTSASCRGDDLKLPLCSIQTHTDREADPRSSPVQLEADRITLRLIQKLLATDRQVGTEGGWAGTARWVACCV